MSIIIAINNMIKRDIIIIFIINVINVLMF